MGNTSEKPWLFTQAEILAAVSVSAANLQNWVNRGYIKPVATNPGRQGKRLYAVPAVVSVAALSALTKAHLPPAVAVKVLGEVEERARKITMGEVLKGTLVAAAGIGLVPRNSMALIFYPVGDEGAWQVDQTSIDEDDEVFDPSDLPDVFVVLRVDRMIRQVLERLREVKPMPSVAIK